MRDPWDTYRARMEARGGDRRSTILKREQRYLGRKMPSSLSYHTLTVDDTEQSLAVINTDNLDTKTICSMPGEDIRHGGTVKWMDNYWLIIAKDANTEVYARATMRQCNYLIKWINQNGTILSRWCIVEDGTKYLTGEYGDREYIVNRGDSRVYLYLPRDNDTVKLNRHNRFLIDDYGSPNVLAYRLTKPFKLGGSYNQNGILSYVLTECNTEDTDNIELHIANYYSYFPKKDDEESAAPSQSTDNGSGKRVWL